GAVFGVGFFREWYTANSKRRRAYLERKGIRLKAEREAAGILSDAYFNEDEAEEGEKAVSREEIQRRKLVRRAHVRTIVAAWVTTVPASAALAAGIFVFLDLLT